MNNDEETLGFGDDEHKDAVLTAHHKINIIANLLIAKGVLSSKEIDEMIVKTAYEDEDSDEEEAD